jgi:3-deoxy-7-phosphoheptulonate synthase
VAIVSTAGNDECHLILRGGADSTNYDRASVAAAMALLKKAQVLAERQG